MREPLTHGSLFTGIGGFDYAAEQLGWTNVFQVEKDSYCRKVLKKNFPTVKKYGDIRKFQAEQAAKYKSTIDIISAGFPCQPFSINGKRQGAEDDNFLWPETFGVCKIIRPQLLVWENVVGILTMEDGKTFHNILTDLESEDYTTEGFIIPAASVGAWHRRQRVFVVAYSKEFRLQRSIQTNREQREEHHDKLPLRFSGEPFGERERWETEPSIDRVADGIPNRMDRIKALGNAVVPQVAIQIFQAIDKLKNNVTD